jgi:hypothetical protein
MWSTDRSCRFSLSCWLAAMTPLRYYWSKCEFESFSGFEFFEFFI